MSARDAFRKAYNDPARCLCGGDSPSGACESVEDLVDTLLDAFAHELAEKQRQHVRQMARDPFHYGSAAWAIRGADDVADLIDPMKEGGRG